MDLVVRAPARPPLVPVCQAAARPGCLSVSASLHVTSLHGWWRPRARRAVCKHLIQLCRSRRPRQTTPQHRATRARKQDEREHGADMLRVAHCLCHDRVGPLTGGLLAALVYETIFRPDYRTPMVHRGPGVGLFPGMAGTDSMPPVSLDGLIDVCQVNMHTSRIAMRCPVGSIPHTEKWGKRAPARSHVHRRGRVCGTQGSGCEQAPRLWTRPAASAARLRGARGARRRRGRGEHGRGRQRAGEGHAGGAGLDERREHRVGPRRVGRAATGPAAVAQAAVFTSPGPHMRPGAPGPAPSHAPSHAPHAQQLLRDWVIKLCRGSLPWFLSSLHTAFPPPGERLTAPNLRARMPAGLVWAGPNRVAAYFRAVDLPGPHACLGCSWFSFSIVADYVRIHAVGLPSAASALEVYFQSLSHTEAACMCRRDSCDSSALRTAAVQHMPPARSVAWLQHDESGGCCLLITRSAWDR